jgi:hypothetical protein
MTPSFTDQIAQSAVSTTMELLKLATGVTLTTTGKLYAPSLQVTRTVLLPSMFTALVEYLGAVTPQRAQDWFRILSSSAYHITAVLTQHTEPAQQFRRALQLGWSSLVECASAPATIQAVVDAVTCWVRLVDALHTPEFRAFLDQLGLLGCRIADAASAGTNHQLAHRGAELAWATAELLSDPHTTCAVAEVTAYLCHALEMEHAHLRDDDRDRDSSDARPSKSRDDNNDPGANPRHTWWCERSRKRRARDQQQRATYQSSVLLPHSNPPATVEEAILSSLGCDPLTQDDMSDDEDDTSHVDEDDNVDDASIPSKVVCTTAKGGGNDDDHEDADGSTRHRDDDVDDDANRRGDDGSTGAHSPRQPHSSKRGWYQRVKDGVSNDVNVDVLRQSILERANGGRDRVRAAPTGRDSNLGERHVPVRTAPSSDSGPNVEDVGGVRSDGEGRECIPRPATRKRRHVDLKMDEDGEPGIEPSVNADDDWCDHNSLDDEPWPRSQDPERHDGETPIDHFYRVLDEVLARQQSAAVQRIVAESEPTKRSGGAQAPKGRVSKQHPTFRDRLATMRADFEGEKREAQQKDLWAARRFGIIVYALLVGLLLAFVTFSGFAAYGAYVLIFPVTRPLRTPGSGNVAEYTGANSELVVRVIREVVQVDRDGKVLLHSQATDRRSALSSESMDRVANCIAGEL